jgi:hypothetical protein
MDALACSCAAVILSDNKCPITEEAIHKILIAANITIPPTLTFLSPLLPGTVPLKGSLRILQTGYPNTPLEDVTGVRNEDELCHVLGLPDEILKLIFGYYVQEYYPFTILGCVCKRWSRPELEIPEVYPECGLSWVHLSYRIEERLGISATKFFSIHWAFRYRNQINADAIRYVVTRWGPFSDYMVETVTNSATLLSPLWQSCDEGEYRVSTTNHPPHAFEFRFCLTIYDYRTFTIPIFLSFGGYGYYSRDLLFPDGKYLPVVSRPGTLRSFVEALQAKLREMGILLAEPVARDVGRSSEEDLDCFDLF